MMVGELNAGYEDGGEFYDRTETDAGLTLNETEFAKSEVDQSIVNSLASLEIIEPVLSPSLVSLNKNDAKLEGSNLEIETIDSMCCETETTSGIFEHYFFGFKLSFLQYFKETYSFLSPSIFEEVERVVNEFGNFNSNFVQPYFRLEEDSLLPDKEKYPKTKFGSSVTCLYDESCLCNFSTEPLDYASSQSEKQEQMKGIVEIRRQCFENFIEQLTEFLKRKIIELEMKTEYLRKENLELKKKQEELLQELNYYEILEVESSKITSKL